MSPAFEEWIGRTETSTDVVTAAWCRKLEETLGREATLVEGDPLPPLWHFTTHLRSVPLGRLGPDGHPARGGFLPPVTLPRRMWAGGRFEFVDDIRIGDTVEKMSTVRAVEEKAGRSGPLCFVTVDHTLSVGGEVRIREEQDLVYRDAPDPRAPPVPPTPAPTGAAFSEEVRPTEVMLFRYSALTFNGHRIHYDVDWCRDVEGYPGLVVHGPLIATLLADLVVGHTGRRITGFSFRALSPVFVPGPFTVAGRPDGHLWAATPDRGLAVEARAELGPPVREKVL